MRKKAATALPGAPKKAAANVLPRKSGVAAAAPARLWIEQTDLDRLRDHLREAQETLDAIRNGDVDAVVVSGAHGSQVYSLSGAEQPYRIFVEQMQEGALTVSADGLVLYCNQRFADMTGLPMEKVISSQILKYVPAAAWKELQHVFESGQEVAKHECRLQNAEDGHLPVNLTASLLPMEEQKVMCLVVTDLTVQREREELRLGKEGAEKASLAKDAFLAALSHELRTPLTPALMATMALEQDTTLPATVRGTLGMIRRNVELEARLIDDLLDLTRIARGKLELHVREVDVHAIIHRAREICETDLHTKQQKLTLSLDAPLSCVTADPVRLQQALWNVLRNAVKFTPEGGSINIRTGNSGAESIWVEVADSGVGFPQEMEPDLFKAFEQGGRDVTRRFGGLGLGLAISHSIMESHQGSIRGASKGTGLGAAFTLRQPLGPADAAGAETPAAGNKNASGRAGMRILLVEDHKDTRTSMTNLLRRSRHVVTAVETAGQALAAAAAGPFDLVISDLGLPDQSGLEMMSRLRDGYGLKGIAVSGYGMDDDVRRSHEAGFVQHLTKPIHMERLRQVIQQFRES